MTRIPLLAVIGVSAAVFLSSCTKNTEEPGGPMVCFLGASVPVRVINPRQEDLLHPGKLPDGLVEIKWAYPGHSPVTARVTPSVYSVDVSKGDQYFFNASIDNAEKGLTIYFSVKKGDTDTLFIKTSASSSKLFGLTDLTVNGIKTEPKPLFYDNLGHSIIGIEVVKDGFGN